MASEECFVVLVHHRGSIKRKTQSGVKFIDKDPLSIFMRPTTSYDDLVNSVLQKLGLQGVKRIKKFFYRIPISVLQEIVKYDCFTIRSDEDLPVGASSSVLVNEPPVEPVASPSFAVDLNYSGGGEVGIGDIVPTSLQYATPTGMGDALLDDADDDDVEPDMIADDSGNDIGARGVAREPTGFGARDVEGSVGLTEFQVGQQLQDKDEVVLSVKT
ncbi:hypothetical protein Ahy_A04g019992 [Arachis hypogaea]|uniref:Uncharacterized protein n=1 Tax=Arachis hypogaea TaxID=3818 RepID=A0A445DGX3_ARAHY|nr:hypothetical protein Ahy_A04g019992 [Arachis hypogaea]